MGGVRVRLGSNEPFHRPTIDTYDTDEADVIFDATHLAFASPLDLVAVTSWASTSCAKGQVVHLDFPSNMDVRNYLSRMNVVAHLEAAGVLFDRTAPRIHRNDRANVLIEVRRIDVADDVEEFSHDALTLLRRHITKHEAAVALRMLGELLGNAAEHANSATGVFVCAQVYQHQLELAVADAGIGVRAHLTRNPKYRHVDEVEALDYALMPGVSGTSERRGNGLSDLLNDTSDYGGRVVLRSQGGHAMVTTVNNLRSFQTGTSVPGTCADVRIGIPSAAPGKMQ
jgi:anti-sigma regulatory factor (Ser/Thr protein kinase)